MFHLMSYLDLIQKPLLCWALGWVALSTHAASDCERLALSWPAAGERISDPQPELRWNGQPGGEPFRVQVLLLLPEARVLQAHDERVSAPRWRLPRALAAERAAVKALVSRGCEGLDNQDLAAQGPAFFIDTRAACGLPASAFRWNAQQLSWPEVPGATSYRLRRFDLSRWAPGDASAVLADTGADTVSPTTWRWPAGSPAQNAGQALVWQALCDGRAGEPVVLSAPPP